MAARLSSGRAYQFSTPGFNPLNAEWLLPPLRATKNKHTRCLVDFFIKTLLFQVIEAIGTLLTRLEVSDLYFYKQTCGMTSRMKFKPTAASFVVSTEDCVTTAKVLNTK